MEKKVSSELVRLLLVINGDAESSRGRGPVLMRRNEVTGVFFSFRRFRFSLDDDEGLRLLDLDLLWWDSFLDFRGLTRSYGFFFLTFCDRLRVDARDAFLFGIRLSLMISKLYKCPGLKLMGAAWQTSKLNQTATQASNNVKFSTSHGSERFHTVTAT